MRPVCTNYISGSNISNVCRHLFPRTTCMLCIELVQTCLLLQLAQHMQHHPLLSVWEIAITLQFLNQTKSKMFFCLYGVGAGTLGHSATFSKSRTKVTALPMPPASCAPACYYACGLPFHSPRGQQHHYSSTHLPHVPSSGFHGTLSYDVSLLMLVPLHSSALHKFWMQNCV